MPEPHAKGLQGLTILVVDDDYFVAHVCAAMLREQGADVVGPVQDPARARAAMFGSITDCVLLDIHVGDERAFRLAEELMVHGVPVVFMGHDPSILPETLRKPPCLLKPVETRDLVQAIRREIGRRPTERISP